MLIKSLLIWLSIIPLAILNGLLREKVIIPLVGVEDGSPISAILLCLLIFAVSILFIPRIGIGMPKTYWLIGFLWLLLTVIFEVVFGLLTGDTIPELIRTYEKTTGNLWLMVVISVGIAPILSAKIAQVI